MLMLMFAWSREDKEAATSDLCCYTSCDRTDSRSDAVSSSRPSEAIPYGQETDRDRIIAVSSHSHEDVK